METACEAERFYAQSEAEQIAGLGQLAKAALGRWGLDGADISPVAYRENMTFRVDAGARGCFALRIHQARYRTDDNIRSELAFMQALGERGIRTPYVVPAKDGAFLVIAESKAVPEPRQCDLFEWIDGRPLRAAGETYSGDIQALAAIYREVGREAGAIANMSASWVRPAGFSRPSWDAEGIFGRKALLGDFRKLEGISTEQRALLDRLAERLSTDLESFGKSPDRYGLSHGDFLPENIMVCADGIRMIDFDDCGEGWYLFDFTTALLDMLGEPAFDPCLDAMIAGYREHQPLPDEHLAMLPAFFVARALSYLGWAASRTHLEKAAVIKPVLLGAMEEMAPFYLG